MKILLSLAFLILLSSCGNSKKNNPSGPETVIELELVDSLIVDELSTLAMDDFSPENGHFLLKGTKTRKLYLVDEKGTLIKEYDILNEGPNGVGTNGALGYRFLDKDRWIAQGLFNGYHIHSLEGKKIKKVPHNNVGMYSMRVYSLRTSFNPYMKNGIPFILGEEPNSFNPEEINADELGSEFYEKARTIYNYNLDTEENELLVTYPEAWAPRKNNNYVGTSYPLVTYNPKNQEMALLPLRGNQLFVYDYTDTLPILKHTVELTHRFRPKELPQHDPNTASFSDYPEFTDVRILGGYYLVAFHTRIPKDIMRELRAKSEEYYLLPEFKSAQEQYSKPYYLLVKDGMQVGILEDMPVHGDLNLTDENGYLYINDNISPEVERDYNVFYKLKIKE